MQTVNELIKSDDDNTLSFGDFTLKTKSKKENFKFKGDLYNVKTYNEITRLEKNDGFLYESVPGTSVFNLKLNKNEISFKVVGNVDSQISIGLEENTDYCVKIGKEDVGCMKTGIGGKLNLSIELNPNEAVDVEISKNN